MDQTDFEELGRSSGICPAGISKPWTGSQKMVRGDIKVCKFFKDNCDLNSQDLTNWP